MLAYSVCFEYGTARREPRATIAGSIGCRCTVNNQHNKVNLNVLLCQGRYKKGWSLWGVLIVWAWKAWEFRFLSILCSGGLWWLAPRVRASTAMQRCSSRQPSALGLENAASVGTIYIWQHIYLNTEGQWSAVLEQEAVLSGGSEPSFHRHPGVCMQPYYCPFSSPWNFISLSSSYEFRIISSSLRGPSGNQ